MSCYGRVLLAISPVLKNGEFMDNITEYSFNQECESLAKDIIAEFGGDKDDSDELREYCNDRAHETADGHPWVIYTYQAKQVCSLSASNDGEEWLEDCYDKPFDGCETYSDVVTRLAYATLLVGIENAITEQLEALEDAA